MLSLATDAHAARQKPQLHVFTQSRFAEFDAVTLEDGQDFGRREPLLVLALESRNGRLRPADPPRSASSARFPDA